MSEAAIALLHDYFPARDLRWPLSSQNSNNNNNNSNINISNTINNNNHIASGRFPLRPGGPCGTGGA